MVGNLMSLRSRAQHDIGITLRVLSIDKKRGMYAALRERVEQFRCDGRMRAVVKREGGDLCTVRRPRRRQQQRQKGTNQQQDRESFHV